MPSCYTQFHVIPFLSGMLTAQLLIASTFVSIPADARHLLAVAYTVEQMKKPPAKQSEMEENRAFSPIDIHTYNMLKTVTRFIYFFFCVQLFIL